ncbi:DsrE family protein [Idiomarina seosinensis]|uniref:DsrE family protein n=1 Tax=Idiomarina seosinensis TaxID=281739 RepID=UPI00384E0C25
MTKRTAILQTAANSDAAIEALDVALAMASMDQSVQLILANDAVDCISDNPSKRYAMLELLDAEPILVFTDEPLSNPHQLDIEMLSSQQLAEHLSRYNEVLQFS